MRDELSTAGTITEAGTGPRGGADPRQRLAVIFNPTAGRRRQQRFAAALTRLSAAGAQVRVLPTEARGDAERLAAGVVAAGDADAIVAAGGDGTINEVINGMAGGGLPLGLLPLGTANVLAWELGIGDDLRRAADVITGRARRRIHLGRCNGRCFVMMVGVGLDAHIVAAMPPRLKRALGKLAYALEGLIQIARLKPVRYRVTVDGVAADATAAIVANGRFYAGRYVVADAADLGAPVLQACCFARGGRLAALGYSLALLADRLRRSRDLSVTPGTRIRIDGPAGDPVQGDGDIVAHLPATIELAAETLDVLVPARGPTT
jgi:YegS/Rv2252/BmrU family lipid kinase